MKVNKTRRHVNHAMGKYLSRDQFAVNIGRAPGKPLLHLRGIYYTKSYKVQSDFKKGKIALKNIYVVYDSKGRIKKNRAK